jgi:hypothetical protein
VGPGRRPRSPSPTFKGSNPDHDLHLQSYVQLSSSFKGGTTVNAVASFRDPRHPRNPIATRQLTIGLDNYSDVTVAHRDIVYGVRPITERLSTGRGMIQYDEEGLVDIVDGSCSFRTIPALVAHHSSHLPKKCMLLLGVPQINDLDIQVACTGKHAVSRSLRMTHTSILLLIRASNVTCPRKTY